tara:strand:+ start:520 stop:1002 length:483 start_codon:yes stop_codon:yes gene_type:complete
MSQKGNIHNPFSSYYNYPKAWGEAEPQERWHSDKSEEGIVPPWLKKIGKSLGMGGDVEIEWDNPDIEKLDKHFSKINKLYGAMDTTELPFMLIQNLYNQSGRDLKRSIKALDRINSQIEKDPDFNKYGGGDYLTRWYELTENPFEDGLPLDDTMSTGDFT